MRPRLSNCNDRYPDDALRIVASGEKEDGPREDAMPDWDQDPMLPL